LDGITGRDAPQQQVLPDPVGVIACVADQAAPARGEILDKRLKGAALVRLPRGEDDRERQAVGVAAQVELGREAAARAAQRLATLAAFAPAAC
jgi:hypothetical protein